jgi:uncharacterized protein (TIGR03086 family)
MVTGSEAHHGHMATKSGTHSAKPKTSQQSTTNDPRALLTSAMTSAAEVIGAVTEDQLALPTPCSEFDVRALAAHLMSAPPTIASLGRGEDYGTTAEKAVPFDEWRAYWAATSAEARDAWADDALLGKVVALPWAEIPGAAVLAQFTGEIVVHTWDLATATDQWGEWQPEVLELAYDSYLQGLPAEGREQFPVFHAVVPVEDNAPLIDRIVAYTGRQP